MDEMHRLLYEQQQDNGQGVCLERTGSEECAS